MTDRRIENLNVRSEDPLRPPVELKALFPLSEKAVETVSEGQETVRRILSGEDRRLLVVVGPCSIHDPAAAREYADRLAALKPELEDVLFPVMRVYFEKPRTTVGWQGLINDPGLDCSDDIDRGLELARGLLLYLAESGLPAAGEALDLVSPQYVQDLISWTAIGARTTESQTHRKMASGFSCAVGFKNATDGGLQVAVDALRAAAGAHSFLSVDPQGRVAVVRTSGNPHTHVVLRGGAAPNYARGAVARCEELLRAAGREPRIMIDCSHANSSFNPERQPVVLEAVADQLLAGNTSIFAVMLESNLKPGKQALKGDLGSLQYGVSVTDGCLGWKTTEAALLRLRERLLPLSTGLR